MVNTCLMLLCSSLQNVGLSDLITAIWPNTDALIRDLLKPLTFAEVQINCNPKVDPKFSITAVPDVTKIPGVR